MKFNYTHHCLIGIAILVLLYLGYMVYKSNVVEGFADGSQAPGTNVGFNNGAQCITGKENWGKCTWLPKTAPGNTDVGFNNGAQCITEIESWGRCTFPAATMAPATMAPTTLAPATTASATTAPATTAPATTAPATIAPATIAPATMAPTTTAPATTAPATTAPTTTAPATTAPTGGPATSAAPAAGPAAGPATTSAATSADTSGISSSGVSNSLVQLLPNLFQGSPAQSGSAVSPVASAPAAVSPAASAPSAVAPAASAPTTANYADAQHQCDTGKVWNQYINQCVAQNGTNPYDNMDKYMLKTKIVPPVCPSQDQMQLITTTLDDTYPPCPACDRCPEPAFHCKKVPNYDSKNKNYMPSSDTDNGLLGTNSFNNSDSLNNSGSLPIPLLADFSAFR